MNHITYGDILRPVVKKNALLYDLVLVIGASFFIALSAQVAIPVSFTPVPVTGQTICPISCKSSPSPFFQCLLSREAASCRSRVQAPVDIRPFRRPSLITLRKQHHHVVR